MDTRYDELKLENQICFPLYACSRNLIREYKPYLDRLDLTYTQYIAMLVLWEKGSMTVKELGEALYLDSGTLTPLLKKLEGKGLITRKRSTADERNLILSLTKAGLSMREDAMEIPSKVYDKLPLTSQEAETLYQLLHKVMAQMEG